MFALPSRRSVSARRPIALALALTTVLALSIPALSVTAQPLDAAHDLFGRMASWWTAFWGAEDDPKGPTTDPGGLNNPPRPRPLSASGPPQPAAARRHEMARSLGRRSAG